MLTRESLWRRAERVAGGLVARGGGGPIAVCVPHGSDFATVFWGCILGGAIPVPLPAPDASVPERFERRLTSVLSDARPRLVVCAAAHQSAIQSMAARAGLRRSSVCASDDLDAPRQARTGSSVAYLQYTSGSTSSPRGVVVTHENVVANCQVVARLNALGPRSILVNWVPTFHDQGLVYAILAPVVLGYRAILLNPTQFAASPASWMRTISDERATHAGGPTAGYSLCVRRVTAEDLHGVTLASWRVAYCAGERVVAETLKKFALKFREVGFRESALQPCYGLAECTLRVAASPTRRGVRAHLFDSTALAHGRAVRSTSGTGVWLASHGPTVGAGRVIAIVDPKRRTPCPDGTLGEIWVHGPHVARGYWGTRSGRAPFGQRFRGSRLGYLRTGDIGFRFARCLFIVSRLKHTLVLNGVNYYPEDIESVVENSVSGLRPGRVAVFPRGTEPDQEILLAAEFSGSRTDSARVAATIRSLVYAQFGILLADVRLCKPHTLPVTTSGKLRRLACHSLFEPRSGGPPVTSVHEAPHTTAIEPELLSVFERVLGRAIDSGDTLADLGLDSLTVLELCGAAARAGFALTVSQFYRCRTLSDLRASKRHQTAHAIRKGHGALLPMQRFELRSNSLDARTMRPRCFFLPVGTAAAAVFDRVVAVEAQHDALRCRLSYTDGTWIARYSLRSYATKVFRWYDISGLAAQHHLTAVSEVASRLREGITLGAGPLWRVAFVERGKRLPPVLLLVLSHYVADLVSTFLACQQLLSTGDVHSSHASVIQWATLLESLAAQGAFSHEAEAWLSISARARDCVAVIDNDSSAPATGRVIVSSQSLSAATRLAGALSVSFEELSAAATGLALSRWLHRTDTAFQWISTGRDHASLGVDLSAVVGCLYYYWPHVISISPTEGLDFAVRRLLEYRRQFSEGGLGYNILAVSAADQSVRSALDPATLAAVRVNYLGTRRRLPGEVWIQTRAPKPDPATSGGARSTGLYIELELIGGALHIQVASWGIGTNGRESLLSCLEAAFCDTY